METLTIEAEEERNQFSENVTHCTTSEVLLPEDFIDETVSVPAPFPKIRFFNKTTAKAEGKCVVPISTLLHKLQDDIALSSLELSLTRRQAQEAIFSYLEPMEQADIINIHKCGR